MSTELKDTDSSYGPHDLYADGDTVPLCAEGSGTTVTADMIKADFIAAVETELNGIFIPRNELPEVISGKYDSELAVLDSNGEKSSVMAVKSDTPESLREIGLAFLAMASYREKNPPFAVDQKQVDALAQILADNENWSVCDRHKAVACKMLATGKVTVSTD